MYVRKFEADSLEEALKEIKRELGPDAIILKTVTNKGFKSAFKKKRIEITAAISEKNYVKKATVDHAMDEGSKEKFYKNDASHISKMINNYGGKERAAARNLSGYDALALNRPVKTTKMESESSRGLDQFLNEEPQHSERIGNTNTTQVTRNITRQQDEEFSIEAHEEIEEDLVAHFETMRGNASPAKKEISQNVFVSSATADEMERKYSLKMSQLESKINDLTKMIEVERGPTSAGVRQLKATLQAFDISEKYIQKIIRKCAFEMDSEELNNPDTVFEFALNDMYDLISVALPKFSTDEGPIITVLVSDASCGQTSTLLKLGSLKKDSVLISYSGEANNMKEEKTRNFAEGIFDLKVINTNKLSETLAEIRKNTELNKSVFVDMRINADQFGEFKQYAEGLNRSFKNVEIIVCLSAIHSEIYNFRVLNMLRQLAKGIIVTHLDLCLNFGSLFNISERFKDLPLMFFTTGNLIPDDIERATSERILDGIFQFK